MMSLDMNQKLEQICRLFRIEGTYVGYETIQMGNVNKTYEVKFILPDGKSQVSVIYDENGNPIAVSDLVNYVIKDENGNPLKEWYAIADYLDSMEGDLDSRYAQPDGRKVVYKSWNPVSLLRNANKFTYFLIGATVLGIACAVAAFRLATSLYRKKKK